MKKLLAAEFPDLRRVETASLHRGVAGARHSFLPAPPNSNKLDVLAQVGPPFAALYCRLLHVRDACSACEDLHAALFHVGEFSLIYAGSLQVHFEAGDINPRMTKLPVLAASCSGGATCVG